MRQVADFKTVSTGRELCLECGRGALASLERGRGALAQSDLRPSISKLEQLQIEKKGQKQKSRGDVLSNESFFLLRSIVGSVFCKSARCP